MGPLTVRVVGGTDGLGGGEGPAIVLLHGFGAPGTDLVGLASAIEAPMGTRFVFPEAPMTLPMIMPGIDSRAWWPIDVEGLQRSLMLGEMPDLFTREPPGLAEARTMVIEMLDALDRTLAPSQVVLGGFSQGAITSVDVALNSDRRLAGLVLFSASIVAESAWRARLPARAGLPVLQTHGTMDPLLPYALGDRLRTLMEEAGLEHTFVSFVGAHEIGMPALAAAKHFLASHLSADR